MSAPPAMSAAALSREGVRRTARFVPRTTWRAVQPAALRPTYICGLVIPGAYPPVATANGWVAERRQLSLREGLPPAVPRSRAGPRRCPISARAARDSADGGPRDGWNDHRMPSVRSALLLALGAAAATAALASAQDAAPSETTVTVGPRTVLAPPATSPVDAPGTPAVRRGRRIPAGYRIVARKVAITRGSDTAGAWFRLQCPTGTRTRTIASSEAGRVGVGIVGAYHRTFVYVFAPPTPKLRRGETATGTVYLVCRRP